MNSAGRKSQAVFGQERAPALARAMKLRVVSLVCKSRIAGYLVCPGCGPKPVRTSCHGETTMPRTAQCLCGAFSAVVSAEPVMVNICHCEDCQRRSGVPWSSAAYFPIEAVRLDGPNRIYMRTSDAGTRINHHFCPTCGVTVCWARETGATRFGIPVGLFNDPSFPAPSLSVWEKRRYAWSPAMENVAHWDTQPPPR